MNKKVVQILLVVCLALTVVVGGCTCSETSVPSPTPSPPETLLDSDGDGMSDWFETNIANLDPLTPNDRYAIIFNTVTEHTIPYYTNQRREETTNLKTFLVVEEKFKPENVFLFMDKEATYENFLRTMDYLAEISDENDLIYIFIYAHGSETGFACHSGKDPSEFEISDELLESVRDRYAWGYDEYWERGGKEEARKNEQIRFASTTGRGIGFDEINELIGKVNYKKMLFVIDCCGARYLIEKISGENLVIIGREFLTGIADTLIRSIVSPDAIARNLQYQSDEYRYGKSSLIKIDDGNCFSSITEILAATIIDHHVKPWREVREKDGFDCEAILQMTDAKEIIENFTNFQWSSNFAEITPKMLDPQGLADDFYFGDAEIGNYRKTDLYLLSPQ